MNFWPTGYRNLDSSRCYWTKNFFLQKCLYVNDLCTHNTQNWLFIQNFPFKPCIHDTYDTHISFSDRAHMSKRCTQINTHRLLETAPVKIARANNVNFPWSHVLQRLRDSTYWSRWRCVTWLILVFIIIILNQQLFAWLKPPFDSCHLYVF